jgi:hypothetical protein
VLAMTEEGFSGLAALEDALTEWMHRQPVPADWSLIALGISAARLIHGIAAVKGHQAGAEAAALLDRSVANALTLFRQQSGSHCLH